MRLLYGSPPASKRDLAERGRALANEVADYRDVADYFGASREEMQRVSLADRRELAALIRRERVTA